MAAIFETSDSPRIWRMDSLRGDQKENDGCFGSLGGLKLGTGSWGEKRLDEGAAAGVTRGRGTDELFDRWGR